MSIPACLHTWPSHHNRKCGGGGGAGRASIAFGVAHPDWDAGTLGCGDTQARRTPPRMSAVSQRLFVLFSGTLVVLSGFLCVTNFEESYQARSACLPLFMYHSGNDRAVNLRNMVFNLFFFLNIYLFAPGLIYLFIFIFIFGCVGSSFLCEGFLQLRQAGATHHRGAQASSLSRPLLLRSTGSRCAGSVVVAHGPSCSAACGIFPDQGSNPCPLH